MAETTLAELTTLRVGGPAGRLLVADTTDELVAHVVDAWADEDDWLVLGGGLVELITWLL